MYRLARALDRRPFALDAMFFALGEQDAEWAVGVEDVAGFDDPHGHALAVLRGNFLKSGRSIERAGASLLDREAGFRAQGQNIDYRTQLVGTIAVRESPGQPKTVIVATNLRSPVVNRAAKAHGLAGFARLALMLAIDTAELLEFVDAKHGATQ